MRWKTPQLYDSRTTKRFLWLPLTIKGDTRWLETAICEEVFVDSWVAVQFYTQEEYDYLQAQKEKDVAF